MVLINLKLYLSLILLFWKFQYIKTDKDINICENVADHIFIQDIEDCTKYFVCIDGRAKTQQCRAGLYFDANLQACIASDQSCLKCPNRQMLHLPLVKTCDKYILCYYGKPWIRKCENNQQFNRITGKCDHPYNVDCVDDRCSIHPVDELIYTASANSCENYYVCLAGKAKMMTCANGLQFSTKCNCCDKAEKVRCMLEMPDITPEMNKGKRFHNKIMHTPILVGETKLAKCPLTGVLILPYIGNPDYYITCLDGKGTMYACGSGYQFDDKLRRCVIKEDLEEVEMVESFTKNHKKLTRESFLCPEYGASIMAHEENNKYIVCINGRAEVYKCPAEQYFDATENICRNVTEMKRRRYGSVVDEFAGIVCPKYATFTFPHEDRHKFYLCLDGKATVFTCADDEYFDVTVHGCREDKEQEDEEEKNLSNILNNEKFDYNSAPFDNKCPKTGRTTLPHIQKNQYYLCVEGKSAIFTCAEGLLYDKKLKNCTENVKDQELYLPEMANIMCPKFGTFKFAHADKTKYYLCLDGKTYTLACDENEYFDVEINLCKLNETLVLIKQNSTLDLNFEDNFEGTFEETILENSESTNNTTNSLALTSVASELVSNVICPKKGTFIYPHAQRNRYYVCIEGSAIVFTCTQGYIFNIKTNTCERPQQQQQTLEEDNDFETPMVLDEPVNILCPTVGAMKFAHEDKNKFYLCVNGMGAVLACANGTFYDQEASACLRPILTQNITEVTNTEETLANVTELSIKCPLMGTFIYGHNDLDKYYVCMEGQAITLTCPEGLQFDNKEKVCRKPKNKLTPLILNETSSIVCPLSGVYKYAHIKENQFYLCINGMSSVLACPELSTYEPETGNCLTNLNITLSQLNQTNLSYNTTTKVTLNLTCPLQGTFVYPLDDPYKYAVCLNGSALEFLCPQDFIFNPKLNKCLNKNYTAEDNLNNFKCPSYETNMFAHKDNNKFYLCLNGLAIEQNCSLGYLFDNETRTCREANLVQKQFNISLNIQCPKEGTHKLPHIDKTKFYLCHQGVASTFSCATGEYFEAESESCQQGVNANTLLKPNDLCPLQGTRKLAHPDRNKYYLCLDGLSTTYSCAVGDYFDAESETCREFKEKRKVNSNTKDVKKCPLKGSYKLPHKDSNKYYLCSEGIATIQNCLKDEVFDAESQTCRELKLHEYKENTTKDSPTFNCPEQGSAKFPHADSNKFYLCLQGVPIIESCLVGDFYDAETQTCREQSSVDTLKQNTKEITPNITCPLQGSIKLPHTDTNKFYLCIDGTFSVQSCAKGDIFDMETETCRENIPIPIENNNLLNNLPPITLTSSPNVKCPLKGSVKLPHNDPNKFYLCLEGIATLQSCAKGDFFDIETLTCRETPPIPKEFKENLNKTTDNEVTRPNPMLNNIDSSTDSKKVKCPLQGSVKLPHDDPNKFYLCLQGVALIQSCLEGDYFDQETKTCREITSLESSSIMVFENIKCPAKGSIKIAHKDPNKFYLCLDGISSIQSCAKGDFFDEESETCQETVAINKEEDKESNSSNTPLDSNNVKCPPRGKSKLPHPNPNKFYLCLEGIATLQSCAEGDFFDVESEICRESLPIKETSQILSQKQSSKDFYKTKCPRKGFLKLPHDDPHKFVLCFDGFPIIQSCLPGDFFDDETKTCRVNYTPPKPLKQIENIKCPLKGSRKLPHDDPNKFYLCLDGIATVQSCAKGNYFVKETEICEENLVTNEGITPESVEIEELYTTNKVIPVTYANSVKCPEHGALRLPHPNPNMFYLCLEGSAIVESCTEGDVFDAENLICKEPIALEDNNQFPTNQATTPIPIIIEELNEATNPLLIENEHKDVMNSTPDKSTATSLNSKEILETSSNPKEILEETFNSKDDKNVAIELKETSTIPKETLETSLNINENLEESLNSKDETTIIATSSIPKETFETSLKPNEIIDPAEFPEENTNSKNDKDVAFGFNKTSTNSKETIETSLNPNEITEDSKENPLKTSNSKDDKNVANELKETFTNSKETLETSVNPNEITENLKENAEKNLNAELKETLETSDNEITEDSKDNPEKISNSKDDNNAANELKEILTNSKETLEISLNINEITENLKEIPEKNSNAATKETLGTFLNPNEITEDSKENNEKTSNSKDDKKAATELKETLTNSKETLETSLNPNEITENLKENLEKDLNAELKETLETSANEVTEDSKENTEKASNSKATLETSLNPNEIIENLKENSIPATLETSYNPKEITEDPKEKMTTNSKDDKNWATELKETLTIPPETYQATLNPNEIGKESSKSNDNNEKESELKATSSSKELNTLNSKNIKCPQQGSINIPHPTDLNKFFSCKDGLATLQNCAKEDFFDTELLICREKLTDVISKIQNEKEKADLEESIEIICPPQGFAKISHDDPNKFYLCEDGIITVQTCAEGDFYDAENGICKETPAIEDEAKNDVTIVHENSLKDSKASKEKIQKSKPTSKSGKLNHSQTKTGYGKNALKKYNLIT